MKPRDSASYATKTTGIKVEPRVTADRSSMCTTRVDVGFLEKISISASLSEEGVIESVGTEAGRDLTPIVGLAAKIALAVTVFTLEKQSSLEKEWERLHEHLAGILTGITARIAHELKVLAAAGSSTTQTLESGQVLEVLHREAAAIDRLRREWIARHASAKELPRVDLTVDDLARSRSNSAALPSAMTNDDIQIPAASAKFAEKYGTVVAIADSMRAKVKPTKPNLDTTDELIMRLPRAVQVGVYKRIEDDNGNQAWSLADEPITLDVVDEYSAYEALSLDGKLLRERKVELTMYPDQSPKTWAFTSTSAATGFAQSAGSLIDALTEVQKTRAALPSPAQSQLDQAKLQLDLLSTSTEYAKLSATHNRAVELAELELLVKLSELSDKAK